MTYGQELTIDMKGCDVSKFNRISLEGYFKQLCELIDMKRVALHFWDDIGISKKELRTEPEVVGISAVQFIFTSSVTVHALSILEECYVNIFSCKYFDTNIALNYTRRFFRAEEFNSSTHKRGEWNIKSLTKGGKENAEEDIACTNVSRTTNV